MQRSEILSSVIFALALASTGVAAQDEPSPLADDHWPQWRGPLSSGVAPSGHPPLEWGEGRNVRWKVPLLGLGHSSPVVWGDRIYVTTAIPFGEPGEPVPDDAPGAHDNAPVTRQHQFAVMAFDRRSGEVLWHTKVREQLPFAGAHVSASLASASPVTDGQRVYAFFGSHGLYCLDRDGEVLWSHDLGVMQVKHGHGEGASPVLHGDTLAINWDHEGQSFVVAFDAATGAERWRAERGEVTSWSTPIAVSHGGRTQLIVSGSENVRAYDLESGEVIWHCSGLSHNVVASPVAGRGMVFVGSSYEKRAMYAIRLAGASGDITDTDRVAWSRRRRTPYVPSPLLYGEWLYFLNHYQGVLSRVRAEDGAEPVGPFRLEGLFNIYASPVGAAGRVYITDRDGTTLVLSHDDEAPEILALNRLEDRFSASAAIAGDELFLRGERFLYCLAESDG
ncbi:MAG: PQQ-binding-like beta-propeller repeat protein [Planctomycetota bacterium]